MANFSAIKGEPFTPCFKALTRFQNERASFKVAQEGDKGFSAIASISVDATNHAPVERHRADVLTQHAAHVLQDWPLLPGVAVHPRLQATALAVPNARPAQIRSVPVAREAVPPHQALQLVPIV